MKKAVSGIATIMAISVSVVAVAMLLMLAGRTVPGQVVYCDFIYEFKNQFFFSRNDICEERLELKSGYVRKSFEELTTFPSGSYEVIVGSTNPNPKIELPDDAEILEATAVLRPRSGNPVPNAEVRIRAGGDVFGPARVRGPVELDFTDALKERMASCSSSPCTVIFIITPNNGKLAFGNLLVRYRTYLFEDAILDEIMSCWQRARHGELGQDLLCKQLAIPKNVDIADAITEASITELIIERRYCHIISTGRSDGCGQRDQLDFENAITGPTNVLIEYDASQKRIVVS